MATWLKQSTSVDVPVGPFLDETDGKTAETALTITQPDVRLKKNNGNWAQKAAAQTLTHEENGWYEVTLDATDTNTLGILVVAIHESGALPVWREFMVVPANVWDSYLGADLLQVDVTQVGGTSQTAGDIMADTNDIQSRLPAALVSGRIDASVGAMAANTLTATAIAGDAITAAKVADGTIDAATFAAGAINAAAIATDAITAAKIADGAIDAATFAAGAITASAIAADAIGASELAADAVTEIQSGLSTLTQANIRTAVGLASANLDTQLSTIDDFLDTEVAAILAAVDTEVAAIKAKTDQLTFTNPNSVDATATLAAADIRSAVGLASANLDTQLGAIDDFIDTEVGAIKAKTDSLTFTVAGQLDANIQYVNNVQVNGTGASGTEWGP